MPLMFFILLFTLQSAFALADEKLPLCSDQSLKETVCRVVNASLIHPTQFNYGEQYVNAKVAGYLKQSIKTNQAYLKKRGPLNAVVGPDGLIYVADGHHRVATYIRLSKQQNHPYTIYLKMRENFHAQQISMQDFWQWMQSHNDVYLKDKSVAHSPEDLPKKFSQLTNDKYRSLTGWMAKQHWCFSGSQVNYIEFFWADYLRGLAAQHKIQDYPDYDITTASGKKNLDNYLNQLKKSGICYEKAASALPGYCQSQTKCLQENAKAGAA